MLAFHAHDRSFRLCLILALGLLVLATVPRISLAQDSRNIHQQTTSPENARYEIVQSELAAKWTFRLDRFTGRVAQLVKTVNDENMWEDMEVVGLSNASTPTKPRFQIFTSGIAARHTFLLDTDTGNTWVIATDKRVRADGTEYEVHIWAPFEK
jgi:hypothetical protein